MSVDVKALWDTVKEGDTREFKLEDIDRMHFVRYAGASGDFNPIHTSQTYAESAGNPTVFGHGMFTAGMLGRIPTEWFGPTSVKRYSVRFVQRIWPGDTATYSGRVVRVYDEGGKKHVDLELSATNQKGERLAQGEATVRPWDAKEETR